MTGNRPQGTGGAVRRLLDGLYGACAFLAAVAMVGVLVIVLLSIMSRQFALHVPGTDAYAGYSMAAAGFLALAHTLKHDEHIRVTLLLGRLRGRARRALELWALGAAVLLSGLFAFYAARLAWVSHDLHDISTGNDGTPLWIPQLAMGVGAIVFFVALIDEWLLELRRRRVTNEPEEALHHE